MNKTISVSIHPWPNNDLQWCVPHSYNAYKADMSIQLGTSSANGNG